MGQACHRSSSFISAIPLFALVPLHRQKSLSTLIDQNEFDIECVSSIAAMKARSAEVAFSVKLIEAPEPDFSASELCRELEEDSSSLTVVISSSDFATGRVTCWQAGADLVLAPNSSSEEVIWGCRNLSRRVTEFGAAANVYPPKHDWTFEAHSLRITRSDGEWIKLSRNEAQIMVALNQASNRMVKREVLWQLLKKSDWRYNDRTLDVLIARIRAKMRQIDINPSAILTHYGAGYELRTII